MTTGWSGDPGDEWAHEIRDLAGYPVKIQQRRAEQCGVTVMHGRPA